MITRRELCQQAMRQGVALGALEKDYILTLTLILRHLYAEEAWRETLVFEGGTALHKLYLGRRQEALTALQRRGGLVPDLELEQVSVVTIEGNVNDR